jgi:hypothetical protein
MMRKVGPGANADGGAPRRAARGQPTEFGIGARPGTRYMGVRRLHARKDIQWQVPV